MELLACGPANGAPSQAHPKVYSGAQTACESASFYTVSPSQTSHGRFDPRSSDGCRVVPQGAGTSAIYFLNAHDLGLPFATLLCNQSFDLQGLQGESTTLNHIVAFTKITTSWLFLRVRPQDISEAECPESARNRQVSEVNTWLCWPSNGRTFASLGRYFCPPFVRPLQRSCSAAPLLPRPSSMGGELTFEVNANEPSVPPDFGHSLCASASMRRTPRTSDCSVFAKRERHLLFPQPVLHHASDPRNRPSRYWA